VRGESVELDENDVAVIKLLTHVHGHSPRGSAAASVDNLGQRRFNNADERSLINLILAAASGAAPTSGSLR
jgi:hypothetical protein